MTRRKTCPACWDDGPHPVRARRPAQLLTDTVIITLACRMCEWRFDIQENVTPAHRSSPPRGGSGALPPADALKGTAAGVAQPK